MDDGNQATLDAIDGRVDLHGPGILFVTAPHFTDNEWREWAPRVMVDGGEPRRIPFGTSFVAAPPGRRQVRIERGGLTNRHHRGIDLLVEVPTDGRVTLHVTAGVFADPPVVTPDSDGVGSVWVQSCGPE